MRTASAGPNRRVAAASACCSTRMTSGAHGKPLAMLTMCPASCVHRILLDPHCVSCCTTFFLNVVQLPLAMGCSAPFDMWLACHCEAVLAVVPHAHLISHNGHVGNLVCVRLCVQVGHHFSEWEKWPELQRHGCGGWQRAKRLVLWQNVASIPISVTVSVSKSNASTLCQCSSPCPCPCQRLSQIRRRQCRPHPHFLKNIYLIRKFGPIA